MATQTRNDLVVNVWVDKVVPCLENAITGRKLPTTVSKVTSKKEILNCTVKRKWYFNWPKLLKEYDIYALRVKGSDQIEGLIAIEDDKNAKAVKMACACSAPWNNKQICAPNLLGVGGHLFAIASDISNSLGYDGLIYGFAASRPLVEHYIKVFGAVFVGFLHDYHFFIDVDESRRIREVYDYEWS